MAVPGGGALLGGFFLGKRAWARSELEQQLTRDCWPAFTEKADRELRVYPAAARDEMRTWFHGKCLNTAGFVREICSLKFGEKLAACQTEELKQACLAMAFAQHVLTDVEVLNRIDAIAADFGSELDRNWSDSCQRISQQWRVSLPVAAAPKPASTELVSRTTLLIEESIQDVLNHARVAGTRPALGQTVGKIGRSALLLMPLAPVGGANPWTAIPLCLLAVFPPVWEYILGQLSHRQGSYQLAISSKVALLGNRVGAELETSFREQIAQMHHWQEQALRAAAHQAAVAAIPLFS
jgi:hypothetical protein